MKCKHEYNLEILRCSILGVSNEIILVLSKPSQFQQQVWLVGGFSLVELVAKLVATLLTCPSGQRLTYDERKYLRLIDATMHATLAEFSMLGVYLGRLPKWDKKT